MSAATEPVRPLGVVHVTDTRAFDRNLCGLGLAARAIAALARICERVVVVGAIDPVWRAAVERQLAPMSRRPTVEWGGALPAGRDLVWAEGPVLFDARLAGDAIGTPTPIAWQRGPGARLCWIPTSHAAPIVDAGVSGLAGVPFAVRDPGAALCDAVVESSDLAALEAKLLFQGRKASDTWVARTIDRPISLFVTRRLLPHAITPNQITLVSTAVGLLGALALARGTSWAQFVGGLLLTASVIIDGCDGEVARIKFMESEFGRKLDFFLDNVVNVAAIFAVGAGHAWAGGEAWYLYASLFNAGAAAASVWPVYSLFFRQNKEAVRADAPPPAAQVWSPADLVEGIAGRDFAYVVLGLACFERAHWFTPLCSVGILAFLSAVLFLWLAQRRRSPGT